MTGDYWSEIRTDDSVWERGRDEADLREWERELEQDRMGRFDWKPAPANKESA